MLRGRGHSVSRAMWDLTNSRVGENDVQNQKQQTQDSKSADQAPAKKTFVEPAVSSPVDVLEATTFFQTVDSGGTGLKRKGD